MKPKLSVREIARQVAADYRGCFIDLVFFEALFKVSTALVIIPLAAWILRWLIVTSGYQAIGNFDILAFLLTKRGLFGLFATILIVLAISFAEAAGLLFIGFGTAEGRRVTYVDALRMLGRRLSWVFKASFLGLVIAVVAVAPFAVGLFFVYDRLLSRFDINYYLAVRPPELKAALWLGGALVVPTAIAALIVYFVANYALPGLLFHKRSVRSAYRLSLKLLRRHGLLLIAPLLAWLAAWFCVTTALNWIGYQFAQLLIAAAGENQAALIGVLGFILALDVFTILAFNFVLVTVSALLTSRLFREACRRSSISLDPVNSGVPVDDRPQTRLPRKWIAGGASAALILGMASVWGILENEDLAERVEISAHRGSSLSAPENTLAAVRQAVADRTDFVEIDVQATSDGIIVVAHDADLMRLAGDPRVITRSTYAELREVDLGSWFGPEFAGERIPTLDEVIEVVRGRAKLLVELKSYDADGLRLAAEVVRILRAQGMSESAAIMSLAISEVREARRLAPEVPAGFAASAAIGRVAQIDADFIAISLSKATGPQIAAAHRNGKQVWVWTVDDPAQMSRLIDLGADNIITNTPTTMHEVLDKRAELTSVERLLLRFRHVFID
jgi:glycerophosphoryl diester phosphodiesterase